MKRLYYNEDVRAAAAYVTEHRAAVWVPSPKMCIDRLEEPWEILALAGSRTIEVATHIAEMQYAHLRETAIQVYGGEDHISTREAARRLEEAGYAVTIR